MSRSVIDAALAEKAEATLKALPDSKVCIRLKAIISSARYPISLVSSVFITDRPHYGDGSSGLPPKA